MEPLVSVIVPIYNVEKYLKKCVDSIINQTLANIEIILVNDGSTDNCGKIIDEYEKSDNRVIAIHKENGGQASARNMGLDIAKGKYIGFVDSDDSIHNDMYENLYTAIEDTNADICVCGREAYKEDEKSYYKNELKDEMIDFNNYSIKDYVTKRLIYKHTVSVCNKIYKKQIIDKNNIRFKDVNYVGSEDTLFNYQFLLNTKQIKSINKVGYTQLSRKGSTTRTYKYGYMNRTANLIKCMHEYSVKTNNKKIYDDVSPILLLFFYQWNLAHIKEAKNKNIQYLIFKEIKYTSDNQIFINCVKKIGLRLNLKDDMYNMGFRLSGIVFIKLIMILYYLKQYRIVAKIILLR